MGCGASSGNAGGELQLTEINQVWIHALQTVEKSGKKLQAKDLIIRRSGWKTVRIFVSSTFKDFHAEREVLVKKVFPDLRLWCESRRIQLIDCDLRWGVPKDSNTEGTLRACLGEIDRCYQDNIMPFFLNMTSERVGWVPGSRDVPESIRDEYKWVEGLSVTEMEIMHGAYRKDNPNALFLLRDSSFLERVPEDERKQFVDSAPMAPAKLKMLKDMIMKKFPKKQARFYKVEYLGKNPTTNAAEFAGIDGGDFSKAVYEFFKERIEMQYPLEEGKLNPYQIVKEQHESFMKSRCNDVLGRDDIISETMKYVTGIGTDVPLLLVAGAGTGKSSLMTKIADATTNMAMNGTIPGGGNQGWHVFYHYVGAVPASTELEAMLKRLLKEMEAVEDKDMPSGLENTAMLVCSKLSNPNTKPTVIIVDAMNQFDEDLPATQVTWVPRKLAPQIRCIFSMIPDTPQHKSLCNREPMPKTIKVHPLNIESRKLIVTKLLGKYNKILDEEQMDCLMAKSSSENPLWLSIACEELRVFGMFREILDKINQMSDGLLELEMQVMERFERESGELVVATLCLLEASSRGLLETELLSILADEDNLMPKEVVKDEGAEKDDSKKENKKKDMGFLPMFKWAEVYRALKPFIRPFGDSGEGRLDFYHRSLSKAVRRKYFKNSQGESKKEIYLWWHTKLADYFENVHNLQRRLEEYPVQLIKIGDNKRLEKFLTDWTVFDELYDIEYSGSLIKYWRLGPGFDRMGEVYDTVMKNIINSEKDKNVIANRCIQLARYLAQAGKYELAKQYAEKGKTMEEEELGGRPEQMADVLYLMSYVADEFMKLEEYMYRSQLPRMKYIIENFEKSAAIRKTLPGEYHKKLLGMTKNRLSFYYSGYQLRGGDSWLSTAEAKEKSVAAVEESIEIFKEIDDIPHLADALITKGVSFGSACSPQVKSYKEAEEIIHRVIGKLHPSLDRLYLNMGIYYEEIGDYYMAFDYFRKWYENCRDLYGLEHPRSARTVNTLREPMYRRIAQEKEIPVPELPNSGSSQNMEPGSSPESPIYID